MNSSDWKTLGCAATAVTVILLASALLAWPFCHAGYVADVAAFKEAKVTYEARGEMDEIERAAVVCSVMNWNSWLARAKYWNSTIVGFYWPNSIDGLTPIGR